MTSTEHMLAIEKQHLDSTVRSSAELLDALLCDSYREFGASGKIYDRSVALMSSVSITVVTEYEIDDYQIASLGEGHILATYKLSERRNDIWRYTLRSSVWKQAGDKWCLLFHQGTEQAE